MLALDNMDFLYEDEPSNDDIVEYVSFPAWRTATDELIAIRDMTTEHIKNCIKLIYKRNGVWRHQYLRYFEEELRLRKFL